MTCGVLANLDVEAVATGRPLPTVLAHRLAAVGTLLRVFSEPDEPLWTPEAVASHRVLPVEGLAQPRLVSGAEERPTAPRVAWCAHENSNLLSRFFDFCCENEQLSRLVGTRWINSLEALRDGLHEDVFAERAEWLLKPDFSAAGRGALRGRGEALLDGTPLENSPAISSLFAADSRGGGQLRGALLEPWVDRLSDFGCRARAIGGRVEIEGLHRLLVTPSGGFRGVVVTPGGGIPPGLRNDESKQLVASAKAAGIRLLANGYEGPFGVDAFAYRSQSGERRFRAQCELNVRMTFGFVAAALVARLGPRQAWDTKLPVALRFGAGPVPKSASIPLLAPDDTGSHGGKHGNTTSAWLEPVLDSAYFV